MNSLKLICTLIFISMLCSCSNATSNVDEVQKQKIANMPTTLQQECEQSGSKDSQLCKIYHNQDISIEAKMEGVGFMYAYGLKGVAKNCEQAKYWLEKSAELDYPEAFNSLGMLYSGGCRTTVSSAGNINFETFELNFPKAEEYFLLASEKNVSDAKVNLGNLYFQGGDGVPQDYDKAIKWFKAGIEGSPARAYDALAMVYMIQKLDSEALPYLFKGAEAGHYNSQYNLGYFYEDGVGGLETDKQKALEWYKKSADQGFARAQSNYERLQAELNQP